ncbi:uncharacterized protein N7469_011036 [Penicillium citrinum]|uniref:Uncharacterized protein n=2 Tax=Penicillium TaxID=5073 RepID=A0A9W9NLH7_PENCI|nr:uncharacterized protein N7469_011036 [Penicillium citrinum]KAJ5222149.1 hypothetical protein N7469_011036 [Penicillium citrinum]KAJ5597126.1 hypothetical protein N7450_003584 [Penicillium hetheringtonii]KAK5797358.1 hypothetical protein VI817_003649 [Penicillium citrinum]
MASNITIGPPKIYTKDGKKYDPPTNQFLMGTWHVTHSSLPLWKDKRNVNITYKEIESSGGNQIDDLVKYQAIGSDKIKSVHGVDTADSRNPGAWNWRGKGWLKIASSHWECLGFGHADESNDWVVTYFAKTLFTPAGLDIYSRDKQGLSQNTVDEILQALKGLEVKEITVLVESIFQIQQE